MRLDKFLSHGLNLPRSVVKKRIVKAEVCVNHKQVTQVSFQLNEKDIVTFNGKEVVLQKLKYYLLHKPSGYVCSSVDDNHPSALTLLNDVDTGKLHFAGRLDWDTTGLVLITSDGSWSHKVTSPRRQCKKAYQVTLASDIADSDVIALEKGVMLHGESKLTLPAKILKSENRKVTVVLSEGRYHQVKRMMAAVGNRVIALHRESVSELTLTGVSEGEYRELTADEILLF